jgi:hypothetical protein
MKTDGREALRGKVPAGLVQLWKAFVCARDEAVDAWEFSLHLLNLLQLGLDVSDLRCLILDGYAEHGQEITTFRDARRRFRRGRNVTFTPKTCFVLTESGARLVQDWLEAPNLARPALLGAAVCAARPASFPASVQVPHWDSVLHVLKFGEWVVKRFRQKAPDQEAILAAFEESDWALQVDDPLPPKDGIVPKQRLHSTIRHLNRHQECELLIFSGDGSGEAVRWAPDVEAVSAKSTHDRRASRPVFVARAIG